jgi:hypothetical protein
MNIFFLQKGLFHGSVRSTVEDRRFIWETNNPAGHWPHPVNYCWVVGNSNASLSSISHLSSSFTNTVPFTMTVGLAPGF